MGRPRKTSSNVSSPQPAATVPKAASAPPQSSASSRMTPTNSRARSAPAAKSKGSREGTVEKPAHDAYPRGTGQNYQTRAMAASGSKQGDSECSHVSRAKASTAAGRGKSHATAGDVLTNASVGSSQAAAKARGKASDFPAPLPSGKVAEIERETRGQRTNPEWHKWRENRITASVAPKIANSKFVNGRSSEVPQSYLKAVVGSGSTVQTPAMSWGVRNEKRAVQAYEVLKSSKNNKPVKVDDCGLFIDKEKSWLAASPDGIVKEAATGKALGVVEVKCPYKHRDKTVTEACKDKTFCLEKEGDAYSLKKSHPYYTQVQCQMGVTGLKKADVVVHTNKETAIAPVDFDPAYWKEVVPKLETFYTGAVAPYLEDKQSAAVWAKEE